MHRFLRSLTLLAAAAAALALLLLPACDRTREYNQNTPEATLSSLFEMIGDGNIHRLPELIYTDDPQLRAALDDVGLLLQRVYSLGEEIRTQYPEDVARLRAEYEALAVEKARQMAEERGGEELWLRLQLFLTDPQVAAENEIDRLGVVEIDEETFAVTIDNRPAFGVGLLMIRREGRWYFEFPQNLPGLGTSMPQTDAEWRIMRSILKSIANGVSWTEREVETGGIRNLDRVWRQAAEDVFPPIVTGWMIYEQALKARPKPETDADDSAESPGQG